MDRLDAMAIFAEVAERESFAEAARRIGRSPAAVTRAVADLEARLGVRLLNRTTRAVSLTEAGRDFLEGAKRIVADVADTERGVSGRGNVPRGELILTAPILFGRLHVLPIVSEFLLQYPDVSVRMILLDRPVDLVDEGIDVAIRIGALADSTAIATRVGSVRPIVIGAAGYLNRKGTPRTPRDLAGHELVAMSGAIMGGDRWQFRTEAETMSVRVAPRLVVSTAEAAIDATISGFGLTRVISYQAARFVSSGALTWLLREFDETQWPVHLLYPGARHIAPKLRAFTNFAIPGLKRRLDDVAQAIAR